MKHKLFFTTLIFIFLSEEVFSQEKITIKMATIAPMDSPWLDFWSKGTKSIEEKVSGRLKITTYAGGVLGDEDEIAEKLKRGEIEVAVGTIRLLSGIAPDTIVFSIPFMFNDYDEVDFIRDKFQSEVFKLFSEKGYVLLGWFDHGFTNIFTTFTLKSIKDLNEKKGGVLYEDPFSPVLFKVTGSKSNNVKALELLNQLKSGNIQVFLSTPLACVVMRWFTSVKTFIKTNILYDPAGIIMRMDVWNSLPNDIKNAMREELKQRVPAVVKLTRWYQATSMEAFSEQGITIYNPDKKEIEDLKTTFNSIYRKEVNIKYSSELLDKVYRNEKNKIEGGLK